MIHSSLRRSSLAALASAAILSMPFLAHPLLAQTEVPAAPQQTAPDPSATPEFPKADPSDFTAESPTKAQVEAFGGPSYQLAKEIAVSLEAAIRDAKVPLVPNVVLSGSGCGGPLDALLGLVLKNGGVNSLAPTKKERSAA